MALYLTVSSETIRRLAKLADMSNAAFAELMGLIGGSVAVLSSPESVQTAAVQLEHCADDAPQLISALMPLLTNYISDGRSPKEVADAVISAVSRDQGREFLLLTNELKGLRVRLLKVLSDDHARLNAKAILLFNERPTLLVGTKIVSDLRPIFRAGGSKPEMIEAFSVIHTLVLTCVQNDEEVKHHIALDATDLRTLADAVTRAQSKAKALSKIVHRVNVAEIVLE